MRMVLATSGGCASPEGLHSSSAHPPCGLTLALPLRVVTRLAEALMRASPEEGRIVWPGDRHDVIDDRGRDNPSFSEALRVVREWGLLRAVAAQRMLPEEGGSKLSPAHPVATRGG